MVKESSPITPTLLDYAKVIELLWHPLARRGIVPPSLINGPELVYLQDALVRASLGRVADAMAEALDPPDNVDYDDYDDDGWDAREGQYTAWEIIDG